jgi:Xaa-Pro aminopeptidase
VAKLQQITLPDFGVAEFPAAIGLAEYQQRLRQTRERMGAATHLLLYADREHFGNVAWLTAFDPRFEEALFILREGADPLLLVGNECMAYVRISPLWQAGELRVECYQPFSLPDQPRAHSRKLEDILRAEGIGSASHVLLAGWKTYDHPAQTDAPAYLADTLRTLGATVRNGAALFHDPHDGLRARVSANEIAAFEYTNIVASEGMKRLFAGVRPGMTDLEVMSLAGYNGLPHGCHWGFKCGTDRVSLSSPRALLVERGHPFSSNIAYWGANCCRAGWLVAAESELPATARGYLAEYAAPYFVAMQRWFAAFRIGVAAAQLHDAIHQLLPADLFHIELNAGHLIHLEEWLSSPVYAGSTIPLASGMAFQSDVIPGHPQLGSARLEDTFVLADEDLRQQLQQLHPRVMERCRQRAHFMKETLGIDISDDVLPLTNLPGVFAPFAFRPELIFVS